MIKMGSFRSYVGLEEYEMKVPNPVTSTFLQPHFLPGELVVGEAHNVLKFTSLSKKKGLSGSLFVTNARLVFVSSTSSELSSLSSSSSCSEDSIPLLSIHTLCFHEGSANQSSGKKSKKKVYLGSYNNLGLSSSSSSVAATSTTNNASTSSPNSQSPLNPTLVNHPPNNSHMFCSVSTRVHELYIICASFRTLRVSFKFSRVDHGQRIVNALIHWSFPQQIEKLFYLDFCRALDGRTSNGKGAFNDTFSSATPVSTTFSSGIVGSWIPSYNIAGDWLRELKMTRAQGFRLTDSNVNFELCQSLPEHFVVPATLTDVRLISLAAKLRGNRPPFWTWGDANGAAILRMGKLFNEADSSAENAFYETLRKGSSNRKPPKIYDLDNNITVKEIRLSLTKLSDLCCPESFSQYEETDAKFYSLLDHTKWMLLLSKVLNLAKEIADILIRQGDLVILQENESRDTSCLFSSIVQVIVDARHRTMTGFCSLIQKDWVIAGHQFHSVYMHASPVFLLFLDSVHQLLVQNPFEFEFNEEFLADMWDSCFDSTAGTFMYDSPFQRSKLELRRDLTAWHRILTKDESANPEEPQLSSASIPAISKSLVNPLYKMKPLLSPPSVDKFTYSLAVSQPLLECSSLICNIEFWSSLFLNRTIENQSTLLSTSIAASSPILLPYSKSYGYGCTTPTTTTPISAEGRVGNECHSPTQASMFLFSSASINNNEILNGELPSTSRGRDFIEELRLVDILLAKLSTSTRFHRNSHARRAPPPPSVPSSQPPQGQKETFLSGNTFPRFRNNPSTSTNNERPGIDRPLPRVTAVKLPNAQFETGSLARRKNPFFTNVQEHSYL